jgi:hypothetical protein
VHDGKRSVLLLMMMILLLMMEIEQSQCLLGRSQASQLRVWSKT